MEDVKWVDAEGMTDLETSAKLKKEERKAKIKFYAKRVLLGVGALGTLIGVGYLLTRNNDDDENERLSRLEEGNLGTEKKYVDIPKDYNSEGYNLQEYLGKDGNYMLLVAETDDRWMTLDEIADSIKSGDCIKYEDFSGI